VKDIVLYCKSYNRDVLRAKRLVESVEKYNSEKLEFYLSVPQEDQKLFLNLIGSDRCKWISDEEIVTANPRVNLERTYNVPGGISQQVVKSEFWRLGVSDNYLCLDSDAQFIREFSLSDFIAQDSTPYTVCHQSKELMQMAENLNRHKIVEDYIAESVRAKTIFNRVGPNYDFGPPPMNWSAKVWEDLDEKYLEPKGWTLWDAVEFIPAEIRWYGEALLKYKSIPLYPIEPMFRLYHYDWQYFALKKQGETFEKLKEQFLGVVYQSNWEYELDYGAPRKSMLSRAARSLRRQVKRIF
jgi:hypothetical protein